MSAGARRTITAMGLKFISNLLINTNDFNSFSCRCEERSDEAIFLSTRPDEKSSTSLIKIASFPLVARNDTKLYAFVLGQRG